MEALRSPDTRRHCVRGDADVVVRCGCSGRYSVRRLSAATDLRWERLFWTVACHASTAPLPACRRSVVPAECAVEQLKVPHMSPAPARFAELGVPSDLCARLDAAAITEPFAIQSAVIPDALAGRDVAGRAPTGSGKTLAFGLPLVIRLRPAQRRRPTALVLAPTRELAEQITSELRPFVRQRGHEVVSVYGGVGYGPQRKAFESGAELVVACPGRLEDLIQSGLVSLGDVDQIVIDEADRMADMGFLPAVRRILRLTSDERQVLLFSATFDTAVSNLSGDVRPRPRRP